ncbi:MAG: hypothetical protein ACRDT4_00835 [Micromonosporaceae bacterium]
MRAHRTDTGSLIFGLLFLGVAGWWLLAQITDLAIGLDGLGWMIAGALVVVGVLGVLGALRSGRRDPAAED